MTRLGLLLATAACLASVGEAKRVSKSAEKIRVTKLKKIFCNRKIFFFHFIFSSPLLFLLTHHQKLVKFALNAFFLMQKYNTTAGIVPGKINVHIVPVSETWCSEAALRDWKKYIFFNVVV